MKTYWHLHPRNFANECTILRASTRGDEARLADLGFERLTRQQARRHIRWINGENDAWGRNRAIGGMDFRALTDVTHDAYDNHSASEYLSRLDDWRADARLSTDTAYWEN